jgi:hypothetical protein
MSGVCTLKGKIIENSKNQECKSQTRDIGTTTGKFEHH